MNGKGAFSTVMGPLDGYEFFEREQIEMENGRNGDKGKRGKK